MINIGSEIRELTNALKYYKSLYARACNEIDSLQKKLWIEEDINERYRAWFTHNAHWTNEHNQKFSTLDQVKPKE